MDNIEVLKRLGLTEYESRAYLSLARLGPSSVKHVVLESKLPRNKAYEALERLRTKGFVIEIPMSPKQYKILNPHVLKDEVEKMQDSVSDLIKQIEAPKQTEFKDVFSIIQGRKALVEKFEAQNENTKEEILGCSVLDKMFYKSLRLIGQRIKEGVVVKFITPWDPKNKKVYQAWLDIGVQIRVFNEKKYGSKLPRIGVFDKRIGRLTIGSPEISAEEDYVTLWTESKAFALMLRNQFKDMWKHSKPIEDFFD